MDTQLVKEILSQVEFRACKSLIASACLAAGADLWAQLEIIPEVKAHLSSLAAQEQRRHADLIASGDLALEFVQNARLVGLRAIIDVLCPAHRDVLLSDPAAKAHFDSVLARELQRGRRARAARQLQPEPEADGDQKMGE